MVSTALRTVLLAVLALALLSSAPVATTASAVDAPSRSSLVKVTRFGLSYGERLTRMSGPELARTLDDAKALGVRWIRMDFSWTSIQPKGPARHRWGPTDRVVRQARARGLRVLPILTYTPAWARDRGCGTFTCPPHRRRQFAAFARTAAKRYQGRGVHVWEIWNEPNYAFFWRPAPDPRRYAALVKAASAAIKGVDRRAKVLHGGLSAVEGNAPSIGPRQFLSAVCRAGACRSFDAVSYHPYTYPYAASAVGTNNAWSKINQTSWSLRSVLKRFGRYRTPIWVTEYGAPTRGIGTASNGSRLSMLPTTTHVTEGWQAGLVTDAVEQAVLNPAVRGLFWYTNQDLPVSNLREASFGLRRLDGSAKPSWSAFKLAVAAAPRG